mmetsp:Transcript_11454/g.26061  ORF Transcript_11454/g.26061 Transcript_11454/m.26061 type:complete len:524 (+) Transcript_11454:46-1617(+)
MAAFKGLFEKAADAFTPQTELGRLVENCTSDLLIGPDWGANMNVCDQINALGEDGSREGLKCMRKRLKHKNPKVQILTLTLLETAMKNCGINFHLQVASSEFMKELAAIGGKKIAVDGNVQEKALELIQAWAEAFHELRDDLPMFDEVYHKLKAEGIRFPARNVDAMPPLFTPGQTGGGRSGGSGRGSGTGGRPAVRSTPAVEQQLFSIDDEGSPTPPARQPAPQPSHRPPQTQQPRQQQQQQSRQPRQPPPAPRDGVNADKLKNDLDLVRNNCELLSEMVSSSDTIAEDISQNDLVRELAATCETMQKRVTSLITEIGDEDSICALLAVNDELNRVLTMYEEAAARHRGGGGGGGGSGSGAPPTIAGPPGTRPPSSRPPPQDNVEDLLGLDSSPLPAAQQPAASAPAARPREMSLEEEFGMIDLHNSAPGAAAAPAPAPAPAPTTAPAPASAPAPAPAPAAAPSPAKQPAPASVPTPLLRPPPKSSVGQSAAAKAKPAAAPAASSGEQTVTNADELDKLFDL